MNAKTTIWTLNRAYELIAGPQDFPVKKSAEQVQQELCERFGQKIQFGQRPDSGNQLMPEGEYFVPIAPKCIGRLFDDAGPEAKPALDRIRGYYQEQAKQSSYQRFWDQAISGYQMKTPDYQGYYSLLEATAPNILIGYSQGALVARYLDWLDKNVFQQNRIQGVITLSAPDFGSPLANPENAKTILKGFFEILLILLGADLRVARLPTKEQVKIEDLTRFVGNLQQTVAAEEHRVKLSSEDSSKSRALSGFLQELHNWLGGLRNDPDNAFYDLNLLRLEPNYSPQAAQFSVLASIQQTGCAAGAIKGILSADWHIRDILYDGAVLLIINELKKCLQANPAFAAWFMTQGINLNRADLRLNENKFSQIDRIYSQVIMHENFSCPISNPRVQQVMNWHEQGVQTPIVLEAHAHDFVIPSAYQLTLDNPADITPDNWVNAQANHLSGSDIIYEAGRANRDQVLAYLQGML